MRLLVATDGSPHALRAAALAVRLAGELREAEVVVLNVGHIPAVAYGGSGPDTMVNFGVLEEGLERENQAILDSAVQQFAGLNVPVTRQYRSGEPAATIIDAAKDVQAEIIVIGCRGLGQLGGLILGSVSERVLHGASVPVLVVR